MALPATYDSTVQAERVTMRSALGIRTALGVRAGTHGDSICDLGMVGGSGVNVDITSNGIYGWADFLSGGRINWVWNAGIGGQSSAQISTDARIAQTVAQGLDFCVENGGTNDLAASITATAIFANRKKVWDALTSAGTLVFAMTLPPRGGLTTAQKRELHRLNTLIRINANKAPGVVLFDVAKVTTNPETGDYLLSGEYGAVDRMDNWFQADTTHLGATGGAYAGYELARLVLALFPRMSWSLPQGGLTDIDYAWDGSAIVPEGNMVKNGKMLGNAGNIAGPTAGILDPASKIANSWRINGGSATALPAGATASTLLLSKVQKANPEVTGFGEWQQISIPAGNAGANGVCTIYQDLVANTFAVGDQIAAACQIETDAAGWTGSGASYNNISLIVTCFSSTFTTLATSRAHPPSGGNGRFRHRCPDGGPVVLKSPRMTIPALTTAVQLSLRFEGVGTMRVSDMQLRRDLVPFVVRTA